MELIFSPAAVNALPKLPAKDAAALMAKLQQVAANPAGQYLWAKRLTGYPGFRIRQGDWRAIYILNFSAGKMTVEKIAKRDEAYK
jgi:mRNA interferase RelE/StbE